MSVLLLLYTGTQCDLSEHKEVLTKLYGEVDDPLIVMRYVTIITLCFFCTIIVHVHKHAYTTFDQKEWVGVDLLCTIHSS